VDGIGLPLSRHCPVTAIDLSDGMLERARVRVAQRPAQCASHRMDATELTFPDNSFDVVYAP
jgi:ubiquinone/menaquinone biosynthesis C-methylase UbiE